MKRVLGVFILSLFSTFSFSQWALQMPSPTSKLLNHICFTNKDTGFAVGASGAIIKTTDAGTTWTNLSSGVSLYLFSVCFPDKNTGYVVGGGFVDGYENVSTINKISNTNSFNGEFPPPSDDMILKSINGGNTWVTQNGGTSLWLYSNFFTDINTGYAVGSTWNNDKGGILKTTNGGLTWTKKDIPNALRSVFFTDDSTGYVAGMNGWKGCIKKTIDGGATWTDYLNPLDNILTSIYFTDANTGYAVGNLGYMIKTIDAGLTWTTMSSITGVDLFSVFFPNSTTGYTVGVNGTILKTIDSGANWYAQESGTTKRLYSVYFTTVDTGYVVGADGIMLKTSNGGILFQVSPTNQDVASNAGDTTFSVTANSIWTAVSDVPWCTTTPSGNGNGTLLVNFTENVSSSIRIAHIEIKNPENTKIVTVTQAKSSIGIEGIHEDNFQILPNPTNSVFKIIPGEKIKRPFTIEIRNIEGKSVFMRQYNYGKEILIDLSTVPQGYYSIIMKCDDRVAVQKLIVVR